MTTLFILYLIHQISLTIGLASSLIVDIFIIIVEKTKRIRSIEKKIVDRVLSYSFISSLIVFVLQLSYVFFLILTDNTLHHGAGRFAFAAFTTIISTCLLLCVATQKYYQIKTLYRYQETHAHLSNTFIGHHKELRNTALLSVLLWIALYICYVILS